MTQYEYQIVNKSNAPAPLLDFLNKLGEEGWQLVDSWTGFTASNRHWVFMRVRSKQNG